MKPWIILFFFLFLNKAYGQESLLYFSDGRLRVDTTLSAENIRLDEIVRIEKYILPTLFNRIEYPEISIENNIQGLLIIKVNVKPSESIVESKIIKGIDPWIDKSVIKAIDSLKLNILNLLKENKELNFYIPVKFELEKSEFEENMKRNNAVTKKANLNTLQRILIK